uniref:Uncharacterized protein n=1 Tax=mine drainage metagenome TaxID=410659 RepID=E6QDQ5_9ZZZZ
MNITPDGQILHPKKGQELARLNPEVNHSALKAETDMLALTSVEQKRLEAELSGNPVALKNGDGREWQL